ncbi:MAG: GIY-YIG nuclease family protein [Chitinophagaceae bacterium]|nr:GIY-YIG nuclease family protein [Chitinophagaceae bacterium]MBS4044508.1 GIY-YIG nuclease family protein [Chitinophagaceae bacterium]
MFYCYVLQSLTKKEYLYKGHCKDLNRRLQEHNSGKTKSNKAYRPFIILYFETFNTLIEAVKIEKYWKTAAGRRYLQKKILVP